MFRSAAALSDVEILFDSPTLREPVHVDRGMWERLVTALLNRALRSGHQKVAVRVSETPEAAVLEVTSAASDDDSGVIAMARRLAEAHGGTLDVESAAGGQSTVRVSVPFGAAHLPPERIARGAPPASRRSLPRPAERVLVVADDPDLRGYLKGLVEGRWNAEAAVDLATALATSAENAPDLILIDGDARSGEGLALAHALRTDARTKRVPMIMIAAAVQGLEREGAAGPDEYITKPFASRDLVSRIAAHLQMSRVREEATRREQKARLDAEAANRAKDEFIAMISHELRTPLGAILIWAQLLRAEELDASATARAVGMIERSTKTLAQLIDDLLDVSRIIAGKLTFEATAGGPALRGGGRARRRAARGRGQGRDRRAADRAFGAAHPGGRGPPAAGRRQPARQRDQVHGGRWEYRGRPPPVRKPGANPRPRHGQRHPRGVPALHLRALPPGGHHEHPQAEGARAGARHRPPHCRDARGIDRSGQPRRGRGEHVHRHPPPGPARRGGGFGRAFRPRAPAAGDHPRRRAASSWWTTRRTRGRRWWSC